MANTRLAIPMEKEMRAIAMIARGDLKKDVCAELGIPLSTMSKIVKRNKENLAIIEEKLLAKASDDALAIKHKANTKLSQRLDRDDKTERVINKAHDDYINEVIDIKEYSDILRRVKELSITELVSVSRTMHDQSAKEEKPPATQNDLAALAAAIASGDEVKITQAIFNGQR